MKKQRALQLILRTNLVVEEIKFNGLSWKYYLSRPLDRQQKLWVKEKLASLLKIDSRFIFTKCAGEQCILIDTCYLVICSISSANMLYSEQEKIKNAIQSIIV